jgi:D-alanine transaminase
MNGPNPELMCLIGAEQVRETEASISPFDRGYLFADGIYEVIAILDGKLIDAERHWARLQRSCAEIDLPLPMPIEELKQAILGLVETNNVTEGRVYFQVTRGVAERDFAFPDDPQPQLFAFTRQVPVADTASSRKGIKAITVEDLRWKRRDIKSIALLPQTMAKQAAKKAGAGEAIMVEDGLITEGSSSTIHMIKDDVLVTRMLTREVLPGVTRATVFDVAREQGIEIQERAFSVEEALAADELFLTSASALVQGIVELDGHTIADGKVGVMTDRLRELYIEVGLKA